MLWCGNCFQRTSSGSHGTEEGEGLGEWGRRADAVVRPFRK